MLKIFLDDLKNPPDNTWVTVRDARTFIFLAKHADVISMDHDLGNNQMEGTDIMNCLERQFRLGEIWTRGLPEISFHSENPVGKANMEATLKSMQRYLVEKQERDQFELHLPVQNYRHGSEEAFQLAREILERYGKIIAIKAYRASTGVALKEAKATIESL